MLTNTQHLAPAAQSSSRRNTPAVKIDGVSKAFGDTTALHEAWLTVEKGEFLTLLGPSGCGKTTILNLIAGFLESDRGEIFIDGVPITDEPAYRRDVGIVFQNYALFPHMTVAKNVGYGLKMRGVPKAEIAQRVREALELVKLPGYGDRKPRELSGGQQQRVALARALVIRPKVLLLDEPFSALDKNLRSAMQVELKQIQRRLGVSTVFVTHDQSEALSMSDRIAVMSAGMIRQIGSPTEIYRQPTDRFVASFVGDTNVFQAERRSPSTVSVGGVTVGVRSTDVYDPTAEPVADLFVRPEDLAVADAGTPGTLAGRVTAKVYQGGYTDLYMETPFAEGSVMARLNGQDAVARWPDGANVGLVLPASAGVAFSASRDAG
ncbi:ABC transporter ATP-binding protein [Flaviflagellibacter deserti]|uniref:Spermidine/putrescine import ATP-binding protein PotA n=2 Tax=Flaviflagellibacter deserti TaxID=2267266 RepID=A0ABV9Z1P5_9HYPH